MGRVKARQTRVEARFHRHQDMAMAGIDNGSGRALMI